MKKHILSTFIVMFFFIVPMQVHAHTLKTDGDIGAVMHVTPEDDPIVGAPTDFFFELKDKRDVFTPENCECSVTIFKAGEELYSQPLFASTSTPSLKDASLSYTFPERNIYTVQIQGKPIEANTFETFVLSWDLRVSREADASGAQPEKSTNNFPYVLLLAIIVISIGVIIGKRKKKK